MRVAEEDTGDGRGGEAAHDTVEEGAWVGESLRAVVA